MVLTRDISNKYTITVTNFKRFRRYPKHSHHVTKTRIFVNTHMEATAECVRTKPRAKHRVPQEALPVRKKQDSMKRASQCQRVENLEGKKRIDTYKKE